MAVLIDTGARRKLENLFQVLQERIPSEVLEPAGMEISAQVAARAPSPESEFDTMMYGDGNTAISGVLKMGDAEDDGRQRFVKPASHYLQPFLASPADMAVDGLTLGVGNIALLNEISKYQYVNAKGQVHTVGGENDFGFWLAWEYGGHFTITPRFQSATGGRGYPLRPTPEIMTWSMTKDIRPHLMFTSIDIESVVETIIKPRIRDIVQSI